MRKSFRFATLVMMLVSLLFAACGDNKPMAFKFEVSPSPENYSVTVTTTPVASDGFFFFFGVEPKSTFLKLKPERYIERLRQLELDFPARLAQGEVTMSYDDLLPNIEYVAFAVRVDGDYNIIGEPEYTSFRAYTMPEPQETSLIDGITGNVEKFADCFVATSVVKNPFGEMTVSLSFHGTELERTFTTEDLFLSRSDLILNEKIITPKIEIQPAIQGNKVTLYGYATELTGRIDHDNHQYILSGWMDFVALQATSDGKTHTTARIPFLATCPDPDFQLPEGAIDGTFSVGPDRKVYFSKGNLQYKASTHTWRFASNQYSVVGTAGIFGNVYEGRDKCDNALIAPDYTGWIDLLGWASADNPTNTSTNNLDYPFDFIDWGKHPIENGGNTPDQWRTLTDEEWTYLLFGRPNAAQRSALATITVSSREYVYGLLILPDKWKQPQGTDFVSAEAKGMVMGENNMENGDYSDNSYDSDQWKAMQEAGAVFLPAAGYRLGVKCDNMNKTGEYWSASATPDSQHPYSVVIYQYKYISHDKSVPQFGCAVRLVRNVE